MISLRACMMHVGRKGMCHCDCSTCLWHMYMQHDATVRAAFHDSWVCRYEHFFHFAIAHLLLYGLVKDFWNIWLRAPEGHNESSKRKGKRKGKRRSRLAGNIFNLPRGIKKAIVQRTGQVFRTAQLKKRSADLLGYDPIITCCSRWPCSETDDHCNLIGCNMVVRPVPVSMCTCSCHPIILTMWC